MHKIKAKKKERKKMFKIYYRYGFEFDMRKRRRREDICRVLSTKVPIRNHRITKLNWIRCLISIFQLGTIEKFALSMMNIGGRHRHKHKHIQRQKYYTSLHDRSNGRCFIRQTILNQFLCNWTQFQSRLFQCSLNTMEKNIVRPLKEISTPNSIWALIVSAKE